MAIRRVHKEHTVGVRAFREQLRHWLDEVSRGSEVVVTERGKPIARLASVDKDDRWQELIDAGIIKPARKPKGNDVPRPIKANGNVTEILLEQRRSRPW